MRDDLDLDHVLQVPDQRQLDVILRDDEKHLMPVEKGKKKTQQTAQ